MSNKIGRNDFCPCGSKLKYKKCCLSRNVTIPSNVIRETSSSEQTLVTTLTNELFQPMRLYYIVHNKSQLEECFKQLKCLKYDEHLNDWTVEYSHEAAKLKLGVSPSKVPKEAQPIIIATIYIENDMTMLVDIRSIERASKLIEFIHQHVPTAVAQITHAAIYNQLITAKSKLEAEDVDYDEIFSQKNIFVVDPEKTLQEAKLNEKKYKNKEEAFQANSRKIQEDAKKPLPKVEKFPVYFYEEGIEHLAMTCRLRQTIAMKHYLGDVNYSFYDLMQEFFVQNSESIPA